MKFPFLAFIAFLITTHSYSQSIGLRPDQLTAVHVQMSPSKMKGKSVVMVSKDTAIKDVDEPTYVRINGVEFGDGTIEVSVLSELLPTAPSTARGFIGIAFRINDDNSKFECIYIRPTNGRADDQVRRNHSIQYFSFPDYKFPRLRKEFPEKYESYADMGLNEWITLKIIVKGRSAQLYLNDNRQPSLVVNDLKSDVLKGAIGLFVDVGTEGYFSNLKVSKTK